MKNYKSIPVITILIMLLGICSLAFIKYYPKEIKFKTIENNYYSIKVPKTWEYGMEVEATKNNWRELSSRGYHENYVFLRDPHYKGICKQLGITISLYTNSNKKPLKAEDFIKSWEHFNKLNFKAETINGKSALVSERIHEFHDGQRKFNLYFTYFIQQAGEKVVVFDHAALCPHAQAKKDLDVIRKIIGTFKMKSE